MFIYSYVHLKCMHFLHTEVIVFGQRKVINQSFIFSIYALSFPFNKTQVTFIIITTLGRALGNKNYFRQLSEKQAQPPAEPLQQQHFCEMALMEVELKGFFFPLHNSIPIYLKQNTVKLFSPPNAAALKSLCLASSFSQYCSGMNSSLS